MSKFQIPDNFKPGFDALSGLSNDQFQVLLKALTGVPVGLGRKGFIEIIDKVPVEGIKEIARMIFSLGSLVNSQESTLEELSKDLSVSFAETKGEAFPQEKVDDIHKRLFTILTSCKNLRLTFKAINLFTENDQIFRDARILTDIRLIFNDSLEDRERSAVIIHRLKIELQKNFESEDFYLSLDKSDLQKLRKQIDRALEKEKLIRENYTSINFTEVTE